MKSCDTCCPCLSTRSDTWGVQGVQNVPRSGRVKTDAASKTVNATSVFANVLLGVHSVPPVSPQGAYLCFELNKL
jgi:hypothetical protein